MEENVMCSPQNPDPVSYKLTSEDYENIWLRIKDKNRTQIFMTYTVAAAVVTIIAFLFISNLYTYTKELVSHSIGEYIKSDNFKQQINATFQDQFKIVDKKLKIIDDGLEKLEIYKSAPINVYEHGFTLVDHEGHYVIVEYGSGSSYGKNKFKSKFKQPPIVTATAGAQRYNIGQKRQEPISVYVTEDGFTVRELPHMPYDIKWIAIGK
jgi:hypothetical protein